MFETRLAAQGQYARRLFELRSVLLARAVTAQTWATARTEVSNTPGRSAVRMVRTS